MEANDVDFGEEAHLSLGTASKVAIVTLKDPISLSAVLFIFLDRPSPPYGLITGRI